MTYTVLGTGSDLPMQVLTNDDIEVAALDYDRLRTGSSLDAWVMKRAGVSVRHRVCPGEGTSDMALRAVNRALADAGVGIAEVDLIVFATFTSDARLPSSVSTMSQRLGSTAKLIQLESACTGFVDAVLVATSMMAGAGYRTAVVVAAEAMSAVIDLGQFLYQSIFGDGAGAVVIRDVPGQDVGIEALRTHTDSSHCEWTWIPGGGTKHPITADVLASRSQYLRLAYKEVYRFAVQKLIDSTLEIVDVVGVGVDDIDWLIPHQTGSNIIGDAVARLGIDEKRVFSCLDHTGNTSGASVAIALDEARRAGLLQAGQRVVLPVVGGGMAWGALSMIWADLDKAA